MDKTNKAKLEVELIPVKSWEKNVQAVVSQKTWLDLRWKFKAARFSRDLAEPVRDHLVCEICNEQNADLHLDEIWEFDNAKQIQKLVGLTAICEKCFNAIHFGRAVKLGQGEAAKEQLMKVNNWTEEQLKAHLESAMKLWQARNEFNYDLDLTWLQKENLVPEDEINWSALHKPNEVYDGIGADQMIRYLFSGGK